MPDIRPMTSLPTDFNSLDADGRVASLLELAPVIWYEAVPGVLIKVYDGEGNSCLATVAEVHGNLLLATPYWPTWESPTDATFNGTLGSQGGPSGGQGASMAPPIILNSTLTGASPLQTELAR